MSYIQGSAFNDHGELARWLENEPVIFMLDKQCPCKDALQLTASELFSRLARGHFARAVEAPEPLPCPWCGAKPAVESCAIGFAIHHKDQCYYIGRTGVANRDVEAWNRRVPCSTCDWKQRRLDALQSAQSKMRDPERTMVCDILANGTLLAEPNGARYEIAPCPTCSDLRERVTELLAELSEAHGKETMETVKRLRAQDAAETAEECETQRARAEAAESQHLEAVKMERRAFDRQVVAEAEVAKLQARIDKGVAKIIKLHGGDRLGLDWQTLGIIATLEGKE